MNDEIEKKQIEEAYRLAVRAQAQQAARPKRENILILSLKLGSALTVLGVMVDYFRMPGTGVRFAANMVGSLIVNFVTWFVVSLVLIYIWRLIRKERSA